MSAAQDNAGVAVAVDDAELMKRIEGGSEDAFETLYDRYSARAYRVARSVYGGGDCAEDAVQEAFVSIWINRGAYRANRGSVAAWLLTVVRFRAIDLLRRNGKHASRRTGEEMIRSELGSDDVADQVAAGAQTDHLHMLLGRLPDAQREVIALAFYGELTHTEIAAQLGLPSGTVKGRIRLGLHKLRTDMNISSRSPLSPSTDSPVGRSRTAH